MRFIVFTLPGEIKDEPLFIETLIDCGVDRVHIRKPSWNKEEIAKLIDKTSPLYHSRLVVHEHHNQRSCHSLEDVLERKLMFDYIFLSPIFDSISKRGYRAAFSEATLREARDSGIIDERVVALGGVTMGHLTIVRQLGFGGAAFLGDVWQYSSDIRMFASHANALRKALL